MKKTFIINILIVMDKFIPCRKCKKVEGSPIPEGYFRLESGNIKECKHHVTWRRMCTLERRFKAAGFNTEFLNYEVEKDYRGQKSLAEVDRIKKYIRCFSDPTKVEKAKRSILYIYGTNGTQKTTIANYIGKSLMIRHASCNYLLMKSLVDKLWASQRDEEAKAEIEKLLKCDVLILDEAFSKDKIHIWASGNQIGYVDEFLRERINNGLGTIFISNTAVDNIEAQGFSHSIQDLVIRECKKQNAFFEMKDNYFDSISEDEIPETLF